MPRADTDRNLLFGILAHQMDFVSRDDLIAAMNAWVLEKQCPFGDHLVRWKTLDPPAKDVLDQMVDLHVSRHGNDPANSLVALGSSGTITADLKCSIPDPDVQESLASTDPGLDHDP